MLFGENQAMSKTLEIEKIICDCGAEFSLIESFKIHVFYNHPEMETEKR